MKKNDLIIILAGLLLAAAVYGGTLLSRQFVQSDSLAVEVYMDGELQETLPMDAYGTYEYTHEQGYNIFEITENGASMTEADCPDLSCTRQHAIDSPNENIVCLPYKFHLVVTGQEEVKIDAISQ